MTDGPRKRTPSEREPTSPFTTNESTPITTNAQSVTRDDDSIAPAPEQPPPSTNAKPPQDDEQRRASAERAAATIEQQDSSRWRAFWDKYGSIELDNKGSVARDHLALERTFLAWLRTSLSFASIGIAITQLFRLNTSLSSHQKSHPNTSPSIQAVFESAIESPQARLRHLGKPLGATFIGISIVMLFIGFHRYFEAQHYIIRGKFPASRGSILIVSAIAGALILSSLIVILVTAPSAFES